jgi:hypothetical protein
MNLDLETKNELNKNDNLLSTVSTDPNLEKKLSNLNENKNSSNLYKYLKRQINLKDLLKIINKKFVRFNNLGDGSTQYKNGKNNEYPNNLHTPSYYSFIEELILYMMKNFMAKVEFNNLVDYFKTINYEKIERKIKNEINKEKKLRNNNENSCLRKSKIFRL